MGLEPTMVGLKGRCLSTLACNPCVITVRHAPLYDDRCHHVRYLAGPGGQVCIPRHHLRHQTQCFFTPQPHRTWWTVRDSNPACAQPLMVTALMNMVDAHGNLTRPAYLTHLVPNIERLTSIISVPTILLSFCAASLAVGLTVPYTSVVWWVGWDSNPHLSD